MLPVSASYPYSSKQTWIAPTLSLILWLLFMSHASASTQPAIDNELKTLLRTAINQASSFSDRFDAEVWLVDMSSRTSRYIKDEEERLHILRAAHREASRVELPIDLVLAVIHTESLFQRFAISSVGAQGLMQVMPFWKDEIGRPSDNLTNIDTNLRYGCTILSYYLDKSHGNISEALARYNGSYGRMTYPEKVYKNQRRYND